MRRYKLSKSAQNDLENIYRFGYLRFGQKQADKYYLGLVKSFESIVANPLLYMRVDHIKPGYRKCVFVSERIYFRFENDMVIISAIIGRQDEIRRF